MQPGLCCAARSGARRGEIFSPSPQNCLHGRDPGAATLKHTRETALKRKKNPTSQPTAFIFFKNRRLSSYKIPSKWLCWLLQNRRCGKTTYYFLAVAFAIRDKEILFKIPPDPHISPQSGGSPIAVPPRRAGCRIGAQRLRERLGRLWT